MKSVLFGLMSLIIMAAVGVNGDGPPLREAQWRKVTDAVVLGLPRTAIEHLEPLIAAALENEEHAEAISAISYRIALEADIQGNKAEERIVLLESEIERMPEEMRPMMHAIMANWYWHFFQQNRWRFMQRSATAEAPGDDILTWDLKRIFSEIDRHFEIALAARDRLRATPIEEYDRLLQKGTMPDQYRPTLYDFVVANALEFYASGEQAAAAPQDAFVLSADSPVFAVAYEFMRWPVRTTDRDSPVYKAVKLYQEVMRFHEGADRREAFLDWDLARLRFGYNMARGDEKSARYKAALRRFADLWSGFEISARARHAWAAVLHGEGESVAAHAIATQGLKAFPDTPGGNLCYNLIQQIEAPSATIDAERVWNDPLPVIEVRYRNVRAVHFRLVPWDLEERFGEIPETRRNYWHPEELSQTEQLALLDKAAASEWSADLTPTVDYRERVEAVSVPDAFEPGPYFLLSSHDPNFGSAENVVSYTPVWVSDLALVMRTRRGETTLEGLVVNALTGEPVEDARVQAWALPDWRNDLERLTATTTDGYGLFRVNGVDSRRHIVLVEHGRQRLATSMGLHVSEVSRRAPRYGRTVFFTDRAIYRPGQTIHYKGICIRLNHADDTYETIPNQSRTVLFLDVNGKEIERQQVRSNDYGSFSGSFTAPRDRLMGRMRIVDSNQRSTGVSFNVEEYKRPTFLVSLDAPETAPKLNDTVSLSGTATTYTGAAVDGAQLRWRVVRQVRFPAWWRARNWWLPLIREESQEIAHGDAVTDGEGGFTIEFFALPDPNVREDGDPEFQYALTVDVTDAAGETRSAQQTVNVGYTALRATLSAPGWLVRATPFDLSVRTTSLDDEGQQAEGELLIYQLEQPDQVQRPPLGHRFSPMPGSGRSAVSDVEPDLSDPNAWPLEEKLIERRVMTDRAGSALAAIELPTGIYRAVFETHDRFGKAVRAELLLRVLDPAADRLNLAISFLFDAPEWTVQPGETFSALWGSGYGSARALIEIEHRGEILQKYWTDPARTQALIEQDVTEAMRGGFTVRVSMVRENRVHVEQRRVEVPWNNKQLTIAWERFVSKLEPGQRETWTAVITGPDSKQAAAEMVATLYDASLDAFLPHAWQSGFGVFRQDHSNLRSDFQNRQLNLRRVKGSWRVDRRSVSLTYRTFPPEVSHTLRGFQVVYGSRSGSGRTEGMLTDAYGSAMDGKAFGGDPGEPAEAESMPEPEIDLEQVVARRILDETAFFFPHLLADDQGEVRLEFTMPEALTQWKFIGFAHDQQLRAGMLVDHAVTSKDLMVRPNPPRFLREGDELEFTVRIFNQSPVSQTGMVRLTFTDARTGDEMDAALDNLRTYQPFDIPSMESRTLAWRIKVPDIPGVLIYKAVGSSGRLSDGEEGYLPVLSRRVMVTESLPLPIRGPATREFTFEKLLESGVSDTLESKTLTLQMVSNPSWYAVMALPYLMEFPHPCSEQIFNRLYANTLAHYIANSDPKIRRVFDQWKGTEALESPLEKNEDLKDVVLEETPWMRQAESESQARRNVGILFDHNRLEQESARALRQLTEQQLGDGRWPWFPGGRPNDYITLYIVTGFGRLRHLGAEVDVAPAIRALARLDTWIDEIYRRILERETQDHNNLSPTIAFYLYGRSMFLEDHAVDVSHREALDYFLDQARAHWLALAHRQSQAHLAIALQRFGDQVAAQRIMHSIRERAVVDEEMGMFWRDLEFSWWWYRAPIETQAMMIEAFDEVLDDAQAVEECKVWLLRQKHTQHWRSTKATADAVYALLLRGAGALASDALVGVTLGDQAIEPEAVEAGTGYYEQRFVGPEIDPAMGQVTVRKIDEGVAWGSLHWQYLEDIGKITPHTDTPLTLEKALFVRRFTERGPIITAVDGAVEVGDELVVRIVLRTDRDMEYVHLKDHRGSGTEPVNVLSRYKYQDGLSYYESTRDTASHFFIDYLPKGAYVFEYSVRIQHSGRYQTGMASVQCMYAPEFNSHSQSIELLVRGRRP